LYAFVFGVVFLEFEGVLVLWKIESGEVLGCGVDLLKSGSFIWFSAAGWIGSFSYQGCDLTSVLALHPRWENTTKNQKGDAKVKKGWNCFG